MKSLLGLFLLMLCKINFAHAAAGIEYGKTSASGIEGNQFGAYLSFTTTPNRKISIKHYSENSDVNGSDDNFKRQETLLKYHFAGNVPDGAILGFGAGVFRAFYKLGKQEEDILGAVFGISFSSWPILEEHVFFALGLDFKLPLNKGKADSRTGDIIAEIAIGLKTIKRKNPLALKIGYRGRTMGNFENDLFDDQFEDIFAGVQLAF